MVFLMWIFVGECGAAEQRILARDHPLEVHIQQGKAFEKKGNLEEALTHYEQALAIKPSSDEIHYLVGFVYYKKYLQSHDIAGKRHVQDQLTNEGPIPSGNITEEEWEHIYEGYGLRIDFKIRALEEFAQALALNPDHWWARYHVAVEQLNHGQFNEAIREYKEVIRANPQHAISYGGLGHAYHNLGKFDLAVSNYKKAINLSTEMTSIDLDLARTYLEMGQREKAIKIYQEMKKQNHLLTKSLQLILDGHSQR